MPPQTIEVPDGKVAYVILVNAEGAPHLLEALALAYYPDTEPADVEAAARKATLKWMDEVNRGYWQAKKAAELADQIAAAVPAVVIE